MRLRWTDEGEVAPEEHRFDVEATAEIAALRNIFFCVYVYIERSEFRSVVAFCGDSTYFCYK